MFYSQFKEHEIYERIVKLLKYAPMSLNQISKKINKSSGGGLKSYLKNLELAQFITSYVLFDKKNTSKLKKYRLTDEMLRFYFSFIEQNKKMIADNGSQNLFNKLIAPNCEIWLGFSLENFCLKNWLWLARQMGFEDQVISYGPYFNQKK